MASLGTGDTGLRADSAVRVLCSVDLALLGAEAASGLTGFQGNADHRLVGSGAAAGHRSGGSTEVCTIQGHADALAQVFHLRLSEAGVSAGCAGLGTAVALLDAGQQALRRPPLDIRMGRNHVAHAHLDLLCYVGLAEEQSAIRSRRSVPVVPPIAGTGEPDA